MHVSYHAHTEFSDDSDYPIEQLVLDAIDCGLEELCVTDHVDYGVKPDVGEEPIVRPCDGEVVWNVDYDRYFPRIRELRERYADRIRLRAGLEFGIQMHTRPQFQALFDAWGPKGAKAEAAGQCLDFVLLSVHQVDDLEFWTGDFQRGRTQAEYNDLYYQELNDLVHSWDDYSVLAHLDLIQRYDPAGFYPYEREADLIDEILRRVIETGHGIEVNTSSFQYELPDLQPSTPILRRYLELGGEILTIGPDSHAPEWIDSHLLEVQDRLRDLGFRWLTTYERMVPTQHRL